MGLTEFCDLWHSPAMVPFATYPVNGHRENWPLRSMNFKRWLANEAYEKTGLVPGAQAVEDTIRVLEARATSVGPERTPWLRVGTHAGKHYVDLCDRQWRVVEIDAAGWRILSRHDTTFIRTGAMQALVEPEAGYSVDELRAFVNTAAEEDFVLVVSWLVAALRSTGPYPILVINAEQGAGKSTMSRLIRELVDPNAAPIRAAPRDDRDLIVSAVNAHMLVYDNLSKVENWLSDALCRLATGGGFSTRKLHSDDEEAVFQATRPIMLNGIPVLTERPDLAQRALQIRLKSLPEDGYTPEDELLAQWRTAAPRILGALLDAVSRAVRDLPTVKAARFSRMADFGKWISAAEMGLGWAPGTFREAYAANQKDVSDTSFEADVVAVEIHRLIIDGYPVGWSGTAAELLAALNTRASEATRKLRIWPATAQAVGNRLDRIAPLLRRRGLQVERRHSGIRTIHIFPAPTEAPPPA